MEEHDTDGLGATRWAGDGERWADGSLAADGVPGAGGLPGADGEPGPAPEVPGYHLGELLGRGGSGGVWAATRSVDGARVAVKVVPVATDAQAVLAARELAVLARVDVEGLVGFREAVGLPGEPPALAVVLDHVRGGSLAGAVAARGHLSAGETVTVLAPVARALAGLHAVGVVHGDVSPGNVLLEPTGRPLLADLGVAAVAGSGVGEVWGTQGFVAPEVLVGEDPGPASDAYAVGALAWFCATGEPPGPGALRPPVDEVLGHLPEAWRSLTARALAGDPAARPTAAELALGYFDAVECEPLRMTVGRDETSLLTQRIRGAGEPPVPPDDAEDSGDSAFLRRLRGAVAAAGTSRPAPGRARSLLGALPRGRVVAPVPRGRWVAALPRGRWVAALLLLAVVAAVLVPAGLVTAGGISAPGWAPGTHGGGTSPAVGPPVPPPVRDLATDRRAPQRDPTGLVQALADERAALMNAGDASRLGLLDAAGSEALRQDAAALHDLASRGQRYAGVRLTASDVRLVTVSASRATLDAAVDTSAYRLVGGGAVERRPAVEGQPLRLVLVWRDARWKVDSVLEASPTG